MMVARPTFSAPLICIDDFLGNEDADKILQECIELKQQYERGEIFDKHGTKKVDLELRANDVIYIDDIFRKSPGRSNIISILRVKISTGQCRAIWSEGYFLFDTINYSNRFDFVVSRYGTGDFYGKHRDTGVTKIRHPIVTLVYYVNREQGQFSGGALQLWNGDESIKFQPRHNRVVVFPSSLVHEVEPVKSSSDRWEDGRFSINLWTGFQ